MPHVRALIDAKGIVGKCRCRMADASDEETAGSGRHYYPVRARMKKRKLLCQCSWDNDTNDGKKNMQSFLCSKYLLGVVDEMHYVLVVGLAYHERLFCLL